MNKVAICIPTYKRPEMLKNLVLSIINCNLNKSLISEVSIIIMDNDASKTAESTVNQLKEINSTSLTINYYSYPVKGLSNVRNELFNKALEFKPDYILGIDDDEYVSSDWVTQLLISLNTTKGDISIGPVLPMFENTISPYISYWFKYAKLSNLQQIKFFWAGNYVICVKFLLKHELEFDIRFNTSGGEDTYFGVTALKAGAKIYWAKDAVAYETIPYNRTTLKWLIKRCFNGAANFTFILKLEKNHFGLLKKIFTSIVYLLCGIMSLVLIPFPLRWKYWGILKISESIGGFAGLFSIQLHEYAKER